MENVSKIRMVRVYEMELEKPQHLTEEEAKELFREEENELNFLISEKIECIEQKVFCSECGRELTEENMWSEDTCKQCAVVLGLEK